MKTKGVSAAELSRGADIKPNTISDWRTKGTNPSADKLVRISDFLQVSLDYLLTGNEKGTASDLKDDELRLLYMYDLLSDMEKGELLGELKYKTKDRKKLTDVSGA